MLWLIAASALASMWVSCGVGAEDLQPRPVTIPSPGAPGTATPTPYPQVVVPSVPRAGGISGPHAPLLPPIKVPGPPPKDQPLPGLSPDDERLSDDESRVKPAPKP
ncbi:hypothetical protein [Pseudomonas sp. R5(2019)]|uniref:hypothetical protein n=1 Tax=Pseudomonas sp. R5(2019) TaxID=2697566 RepID=UPI0015B5DE7B